MDKIYRTRRIHQLAQCLPSALAPRVGVYFGEHVIRVADQLCIVVTLDGKVGLRATTPQLKARLRALCGEQHWRAHGRQYDDWYLLPAETDLSDRDTVHLLTLVAESASSLSGRGDWSGDKVGGY